MFPGKNCQVSRFPEKSPDSRNNFSYVPKQRLLELSPPVIVYHGKTIYERYRFRTTVSIQEGRSIDLFVTDLRRRADYCDFGAIKESLIRDQIVVGISDPKLRERLLRETDLTLEKAVKLCRITEQSKEQSKIFSSPPTEEGSIDTVKKIQPPVDTGKSKQEESKNTQMQILRHVSQQRKLSRLWRHVSQMQRAKPLCSMLSQTEE